MAQANNPFDFVARFLDSTIFLSTVAVLILCTVAWALWRG